MKGLASVRISLAMLALTSSLAMADEPLLIQSNTSISAVNQTFEGRAIVVQGATLTIDGAHSFESLTLTGGAIVRSSTGQKLTLNVASVSIDATSRIDVSALGQRADSTLTTNYYTGGSYGGRGGNYFTGSTYYYANASYGDYRLPRELGTGGRGSSGNSYLSYGGGAVEVQAQSLTLEGKILANGQTLSSSGGGSGGAVLLQVDSLTLGAQALIQADGGGGSTSSYYGGGGGGRVALYYRSVQGDLSGRLSAKGGLKGSSASYFGGAGTVYVRNQQSGEEQLTFDNAGISEAISATSTLPTSEPFSGRLIIRGKAKVSLAQASISTDELGLARRELLLQSGYLTLSPGAYSFQKIDLQTGARLDTYTGASEPVRLAVDEVNVSADSSIDFSGRGDLASIAVANGSGGSHGGLGGRYQNTGSVNPQFGDAKAPVTRGVGGRGVSSGYTRGGAAISLNARLLNLQGSLLADGGTTTVGSNVGGGAGGSIWLNTQVLRGGPNTQISARGGNALGTAGAGGGGRIALYYGQLESLDPISQVSVAAGTGTYPAGVGSLHMENHDGFIRVLGTNLATLTNQSIQRFNVEFSAPIAAETLNLQTLQLLGQNGPLGGLSIQPISPVTYSISLVEPLADGRYELRVAGVRSAQGHGMDQNGNAVEGEPEDAFVQSFEVDRQPPQAPQVTSAPLAPAVTVLTTRQVNLSGTREPQTAVLLNDSLKVAVGEGTWSINGIALVEGENTLRLRARDAANNLSDQVQLKFLVDSIAPSVSARSPAAGGYLRTAPSSIWLTVNEAGTGLDLGNSTLTLKKGGVSIGGELTLEGGDTLTLRPSATLTEGSYSYAYRLQDLAGNAITGTSSFSLDYTAPQPPALNAYPSVTTNAQVTLSGAKENNAQLEIFDVNGQRLTSICCAGATWSYTATLQPGDNLLRLRQRDQASNYSLYAEALIRFDNQAPGPVSFQVDPKGSGTELKLDWTGYSEAANGNDIQEYRIYRADQAFTDISQAVQISSVVNGRYNVTLQGLARDQQAFYAVLAVDKQGLLNPQVQSLAATPEDVRAPANPASLQVLSAAEHLDLSWQASANPPTDLKGYRLYVGAQAPQRIELPLTELSDGLRYRLAGLQPGSSNPLRLVSVDETGNESAGLSNPGITWLDNPEGIQLTPYANRIEASWQAVTPADWVSGYRLYLAEAPFSTVVGMTPRLNLPANQLRAQVAGLENGKTYYAAVTVLNASGGENPQVAAVSVTPEADSQGPELLQLLWRTGGGDQPLADGDDLDQLGELRLRARDESGIARIEVSLDGQPLGLMQPSSGDYRLPWDITQVADGEHALAFKLYDTLDNLTEANQSVEVALLPPSAPQISLQSKASSTNQAQQVLVVKGQPLSRVRVLRNGEPLADNLQLSAQGEGQQPITLQEGENTLLAALRYATRDSYGADSAPLTVTLDTRLPDAPSGLQAQGKAQGIIQLSWAPLSAVKGYNLYVAPQPFAMLSDAGVSKANNTLITSAGFSHQPSNDGTYYYRVAAVNTLGSESALSAQQSALSDSLSPRVEEAIYSSEGRVSADGRYAPGRINVRLRLSEPLRNTPFFSLDVPQGVSIPVRLSQAANDPQVYEGAFDLAASVPSGLLYGRISAYDRVGNEGTDIAQGSTLRVDTQGPDVVELSLLPQNPLENQVVDGQGAEVEVLIRLADDAMTSPQLKPLLNGQSLSSQPSALSLVEDGQSQAGAPVYTGRFRLPAEAGEQQVDMLSFSYQAEDDLGNRSERIAARNEFQVYQGQLPPLDIPTRLTAKAQAAGRVALSWDSVAEAGAYQLYRKVAGAASYEAVARVRQLQHLDDLPLAGLADGTYYYQVASIREHEGREALSLPSEAVEVVVDSQAPGAPRELRAELTGSGIVLRWQAPEQGNYTYNLYRVDAGQGEAIDITGLAPLQSKIPALIALDSRPSQTQHSYTLTAVDGTGNESPAAEPVYLNAGLLPVTDLNIRLPEDQGPVLSWSHEGSDIAGYNVYLEQGGQRQRLNSSLLTTQQWQDLSVSRPLTAVRQYSVTAVDNDEVESMPHSLQLPLLTASLREGQVLKRGVFNTLYFQVGNAGEAPLQGLRLSVSTLVAGQTKTHTSEVFSIPAGGMSEVPVVIAGYPQLPGVVTLSLQLSYTPQAGERVTILSQASVDAGDEALLAQLQADTFTRGSTGSVRLRVENPSQVPIELVTAKSSGKLPSDEMRVILEDLQGNVLAQQPVKAVLGNGLITVSDGRTVARVGAGEALELGPFTVPVPLSAPDQVRARLVVDALRYQTGRSGEQSLPGLRVDREVGLNNLPYVGELISVEPATVQGGGSVTLQGRAVRDGTQEPLGNVELRLLLGVRGFEQGISVTTDASGQFRYVYKTQANDSGTYQVSVIHPALTTRPQQGQFQVNGVARFAPASMNLRFPRNYTQLATVEVEAGYGIPLKNLRLEYVPGAGGSGLPTGLKVVTGQPVNLGSRERASLTLRISGDNTAAASGLLDYRIVADDLDQPVGQTRIQYQLVEASPVARLQPTQLRTGTAREQEQLGNFTLSNSGLDVLRNARLRVLGELGAAVPSWVSLRTSASLGDIPAGGSGLITLSFRPGAAVAEGEYYFTLQVESDNHPMLQVPIQVAVTQSGKGGVVFQVEDIYTGTLDEEGQRILGLQGARIKLQNRNVLTSEYSATTNERGQVLLEDIPAGEYSYRISAWDHEDLTGQLWIKPGITADERVFLMSRLVTVEWSVKEITLEDRYEIVLDATFKTKVPTALVMIEPLVVNLPAMRKGDVFQGELTLTNYGLIRADNVQGQWPTGDARARIEYLRPLPSSLLPGEVVVIPYRVQALQSFDPDDEVAGAAGCWSFGYPVPVQYSSQCANGQTISSSTSSRFTSNGATGSCGALIGGGGGIGGALTGGASGGWGGGGSSRGGSGFTIIPRPTPLGTDKQCPPPTPCITCEVKKFFSNGSGG